jgi:hypothetical protein
MKNRPQQRDHDLNQQIAKSTRPQLPRDGSKGMMRWEPGQMPVGGFRAIIPFCGDGYYDTKQSPTSGGGKRVY